MKNTRIQSGFTLVEILIALLLATFVTLAAFRFYIAEHNNMLVQENISDMQQNLRASIDDVTRVVRNAGANLPAGVQGLSVWNSNPDTLLVRYATMGGTIGVADHTNKSNATPIHVPAGSDLSAFVVGDLVYLWHVTPKTGEWFTVSNISTNNGAGWGEIHHQGQNFTSDPVPGDQVVKMQEVKFYIDTTNLTHPALMKVTNGAAAQVFSDNIKDLQLQFLLKSGATVQTLGAADTVYVVQVAMTSMTDQVDIVARQAGQAARRQRMLTTQIMLRNNKS